MSELGSTLRQAREAAGLSLAGMARRTGYSRSYLGNVESGVRNSTSAVIRAYERALGEQDVNRRDLMVGLASTAVAAAAPDVAVDVVRDIAAERNKLLWADAGQLVGRPLARTTTWPPSPPRRPIRTTPEHAGARC